MAFDGLDASDGVVEAIARRVVELLRDQASGGQRMLSAQQVADRYGLSRAWVYEHAEELGVVRIGDGRRPRLRFDPVKVARRLDAVESPPKASPRRDLVPADEPLLPFYGRAAAN